MTLNNSFGIKYACLIAALAVACGPDKSDTGDDTEASTGASTTDTPTTGGPLQDMCTPQGAISDVTVAWDVPPASCESEVCSTRRESRCTVVSITSDGPTVLTLECSDPDFGPWIDVVTIDLQPGDAIDLVVGTVVQLTHESEYAFEGGSSDSLRITDDRGLVLAAGSIQRYGGSVGGTQWALDYLAGLALPLTATIASAACPDDGDLSAITVATGEFSVVVHEGSSAFLNGGDTWLVVVEHASVDYSGMLEGHVDLAILRAAEG